MEQQDIETGTKITIITAIRSTLVVVAYRLDNKKGNIAVELGGQEKTEKNEERERERESSVPRELVVFHKAGLAA